MEMAALCSAVLHEQQFEKIRLAASRVSEEACVTLLLPRLETLVL